MTFLPCLTPALLWLTLLATSASASEAVVWAAPGQEPEHLRPIAVVSGRSNTLDFVLGPGMAALGDVQLSLYGLGGPLAAPLIFRQTVTPRDITQNQSNRRYRLDVDVPQAMAGTRLLLLLEIPSQATDRWRLLSTVALETYPADQFAPVRAFAHGAPIAIDDKLSWLKEFFLSEEVSCISLSPSASVAPALAICSPGMLATGCKPPAAAVLLVLSATDDAERLIIVRPRTGGGIIEAHLPHLNFLTTDPRVRQDFLRAFRIAIDLLSSSQTRPDP